VIDQGGAVAFRRLASRQLPLSYWVVRFFQPEKKPEWKILIDTRRSRVAAFVNPVEEDAAAKPPPSSEEASRRTFDAAARLGYPAAEYAMLEVGTEARPKRVDTTVVLESKSSGIGEARPRLTAVFHGARLASFLPTIRVPESFMRAHRKKSAAEVLLLGVKIVALGGLVGLVVILFLRLVRQPDFRWRRFVKPIVWTGILATLGLANTVPYLFRQYSTEMPMNLFRLGLGVSLSVGLLGILLVAAVGFALWSGARPGWLEALRRKGTFGDALLRAAIAAGGLLGLSRWFHVVSSRIPALYDPDPSLPSSLQLVVPAFDVLWSAARGGFAIAVLAAAMALASRSAFFRTPVGRVLAAAAILAALLPSTIHSPTDFTAEFLPALLAAIWLAICSFSLLRDHAAAWALFGLIAFGGRGAIELLAQPARPDRAAGALAAALLILAGVALLAGRRDRPPPVPELPP
jgi:hypothetical protein